MSKDTIIISADEDKGRMLHAFIVTTFLIAVLWVIKVFEIIADTRFVQLGVFPKEFTGLIGLFTAPLVHADIQHLVSNSGGLFFSMLTTIYLYRQSAYKTIAIIWILSGLIIWIFGRPAYHIGASGVVYGLMSFLFFSGIFRRDKRSVALSLIVIFLYGSMVWGLFPIDISISNEAHIAGAIIGFACAFGFRHLDPPAKYEWEPPDEEDEDDYVDEYNPDVDPDKIKIEDDAEPRRF